MTLTRAGFGAFFAAVHGGHQPFRWQERLLDQVLTGRWPHRIAAPTGAGKTAVIDVHVFAVALMAVGAAPSMPRRLAVVVDRRALVDDQFEHSRAVARLLHEAWPYESGGVLGEVARALRALRIEAGQPDRATLGPLVVGSLRGGLPPSRGWRDDPVACTVLHATPDMWGSRLLLRGYGSSRPARPREAGLLAHDAVVVVDEAHLCRQLVHTARRVAELQSRAPNPVAPPLQVVETTATPGQGTGVTVGVEEDDLAADPLLAQRLCTPKPVRLLPLDTWPIPARGAAHRAGIEALVGAVRWLHSEFGATVGCLVNTVGTAVAVARALEPDLTAVLLCGRRRPHDLATLRAAHEGLLDIRGNAGVDVVVATQTLEVGVDVDLHAMVTELAPGSSLAQRAGRVNRLGARKACVEVAVPIDPDRMAATDPYQPEDLREALAWLRDRAATGPGLAPWALRSAEPPARALGRVPGHPAVPPEDDWQFLRLEAWDAWQLARTSDDLAAEPDLDLWLADNLAADRDVGVLVRDGLDDDLNAAVEMVRMLRPRRHEVFPTPISTARRTASRVLADPESVVIRVRGDDVDPLDDVEGLRAGDLLVLDSKHRLLRADIVDDDPDTAATDVFELHATPDEGLLSLVVSEADDAVAVELVEARFQKPPRNALADLLVQHAAAEPAVRVDFLRRVADLLRGRLADVDVTVQDLGDSKRILVADQRRARRDDEARQTWTRATEHVLLDVHQQAVAERAARVAERVGLDPDLLDALRRAGLHHDDGKVDPRFQVVLGADGGPPLAKSHGRSPAQNQVNRSASGLPAGWRHEQLSAVRCWSALAGASDRDLVTRLVGTSHGRGRASFPHTGRELAPGDEQAVELFDDGRWDEIVENTDRRHGVWGTAYLEALLRAADGQVSGEGS